MNQPPNAHHGPPPPSDRDTPSELAHIDALLQRLGAAERSAADEELEIRTAGATLGDLLGTHEIEHLASRMGTSDRNAAPVVFEERVYEASLPHLATPAAAPSVAGRITHAPAARASRAPGGAWVRRLALAACLGLVGTAALLGTRAWLRANSTAENGSRIASTSHTMSTTDLKASLDAEMDMLLTAVSDQSAEQSAGGEHEFDAEWIDDLVDGGRAS